MVYAGGAFTNIGGQTRNFIAALDASTGNATNWDPNANDFGAFPFVYGTVMTSIMALAISVPLGVGAAIFGIGWGRIKEFRTLLQRERPNGF